MTRITAIIGVISAALGLAPASLAQDDLKIIADFEGANPIAGNQTTHQAIVTAVDDVPPGGGRVAVKTVVGSAAPQYFGSGFSFAPRDLSKAAEVRFWIKTDIQSSFNFQIHSSEGVSVFPFRPAPGKWEQIAAPMSSFTKPSWAKGSAADWTCINKWQVTAYGNGPYDGKYIVLDHLVCSEQSTAPVKQLARTLASRPQARPGSPNVLFILTDDLGWRDLGCYGSDFYETPNIDRLASQGMRFTDAYAAATVCSPTRAAILTGKTPARLHITDFLSGIIFPHTALQTPDWQRHQLPLEEFTLGEMMQQAGYETFFFGKWHLGGEEYFPDKQGFDHTMGVARWGWPGTYFYPWPQVRGLTGKKGDYLTDRLTDEVIKSLRRKHDRPFFTFLSYFTPHRPTMGKEEHIKKYEAKLRPEHIQRNPTNAAMIHSLDENVGRLMKSLDDLKIADDTLVIFASDNGGNHYADIPQKTSNAPLRDGKGAAYEGAYRVPLIVRWPGNVKAGTETTEPVSSIDFFPTLQALTKQERAPDIDGINLLPLLLKQQPLGRDALYWHYPHYHHGGASPHGVIRKGSYRLVDHFDGTPAELYDIQNDIGEAVNLVNTQPEVAEDMLADLKRWRKKVGAQMPTINPNYDPDRVHESLFYHQWLKQQQSGN